MMDCTEWLEPDSVISCDASLVHSDFPDFINVQSFHINELELLTVWRSFLRGKKIVVNCKKSTSFTVINSG